MRASNLLRLPTCACAIRKMTRLASRIRDLTLLYGRPWSGHMDEPSGGISMAGEWTARATPEVVASASGRLWSFVDARELRQILGQLIAAEVLRMSLAELLNRPAAR